MGGVADQVEDHPAQAVTVGSDLGGDFGGGVFGVWGVDGEGEVAGQDVGVHDVGDVFKEGAGKKALKLKTSVAAGELKKLGDDAVEVVQLRRLSCWRPASGGAGVWRL